MAANVRPGWTGSESTPPWPKIHGFSINTTSWPASGEYTLQPTSPNAINIIRYFIDLPFQIRIATVCVHPLPTAPAQPAQLKAPVFLSSWTARGPLGIVEEQGVGGAEGDRPLA